MRGPDGIVHGLRHGSAATTLPISVAVFWASIGFALSHLPAGLSGWKGEPVAFAS